MENDFIRSKFSFGLALLALGSILVFGQKPQDFTNQDTFASEPVKVEGFDVNTSQEKIIPQQIIIPKLSIDLSVKEAKIIEGYWEVFDDYAGWGEGSGQPGLTGNQVIFAHAREGLFLPLRNIQTGDNIYVFTDTSWFIYQVKEVKEVYPNQVEVIAPTEDETLTLYTCSGYNDSMRLIVIAKRK
jgi:LPXTG-site transpeptidase (sortase) family protein